LSIFEVHIEASSFLAAQRRALQARPICPPRPLLGADSGSDVRWTNFHRGAIADHLGGRQWAFLADSGILEGRHTAEIARAIRESAPAEPPCTSAESR
jgi:hypothetical protein